ncbi:hypothetical protein LUU34_01543600 [Aix galericulata]|nr:hypothetical protein LUU34_01543600 [Aix galericulata]
MEENGWLLGEDLQETQGPEDLKVAQGQEDLKEFQGQEDLKEAQGAEDLKEAQGQEDLKGKTVLAGTVSKVRMGPGLPKPPSLLVPTHQEVRKLHAPCRSDPCSAPLLRRGLKTLENAS